jgi:hypothetical protein
VNQEEQQLRERKTEALMDLVSEQSWNVKRSKESLRTFLSFFARIANHWSAPNAIAIFGQRPHIRNPITIDEAQKLGHTIKHGAKAISILEPTAVDDNLVNKSQYLRFRKWALDQGLTERELRRVCLQHIRKTLADDLDLHSVKAGFALKQLIVESYPELTREQSNQLYTYACQYLFKEGAFDQEEVSRGINLYQWKAKTSVVDLGIDTHGPKLQRGVEMEKKEFLAHRQAAALLRFIESMGFRVDYQQLQGMSAEAKLDSLMHSAISVLAHERDQKINIEAAAFCIYSHLGIERKFDISTLEGWGEKPGEFMTNLSAIRKIQKEITTGMEREMETIARLERELASAENHASKLRERLAELGISAKLSDPVERPAQPVAEGTTQIIKTGQSSRHTTLDELCHQGLYFKIGRSRFLTYHEAAEFLVACRFVDRDGKECKVQLRMRHENGEKQTLCEMSASSFVQEVINIQAEPTMVSALDSALANRRKQTNQTADRPDVEIIPIDKLARDPEQRTRVRA